MKIGIFLSVLLVAGITFSCQSEGAMPANQGAEVLSNEALIEQGAYLTLAAGCDHCHTPKKMTPEGPAPDMDRWMMGFPADAPLPEIDTAALRPGSWTLFHPELTAAVGPWGLTYAANITPHETGIGTWSVEQFKKAIQEGKHKGLDNGRPIMPPMPWQPYSHAFSDADLEAMFAYLQSIEPIENVVPAFVPADVLRAQLE